MERNGKADQAGLADLLYRSFIESLACYLFGRFDEALAGSPYGQNTRTFGGTKTGYYGRLMKNTQWPRLLAYVTGLVNHRLLLQNEYLVAENRVLRTHLPARLRLSDPERSRLAEIGNRLMVGASRQVRKRCYTKQYREPIRWQPCGYFCS